MQNRLLALFALSALFAGPVVTSAQAPFHIEQRWVIGGEGWWDYLTVDPATHRLYVAHSNRVDVIDTNSGKVIGAVNGLKGCHGVVIPPGSKVGFVTDGGANDVVAFDLTSFAPITKIPTGTNPDGAAYEPTTNTLWAFNGSSKNVTVIDLAKMVPIATIALPGKPEFPQVDGKGTVFVNIEDKNEVIRLDAKTLKATATWPLSRCESPSGMAIDLTGRRLFSVCDGNRMAVTDATTGASLATPIIGDGPDAAGYDPTHKLAFSSNGDGTLTVIDTGKPGYPVAQSVVTGKGARTMAYDPTADKIYLVTSKFAAPDPTHPNARPAQIPGTFTVLVLGR